MLTSSFGPGNHDQTLAMRKIIFLLVGSKSNQIREKREKECITVNDQLYRHTLLYAGRILLKNGCSIVHNSIFLTQMTISRHRIISIIILTFVLLQLIRIKNMSSKQSLEFDFCFNCFKCLGICQSIP